MVVLLVVVPLRCFNKLVPISAPGIHPMSHSHPAGIRRSLPRKAPPVSALSRSSPPSVPAPLLQTVCYIFGSLIFNFNLLACLFVYLLRFSNSPPAVRMTFPCNSDQTTAKTHLTGDGAVTSTSPHSTHTLGRSITLLLLGSVWPLAERYNMKCDFSLKLHECP